MAAIPGKHVIHLALLRGAENALPRLARARACAVTAIDGLTVSLVVDSPRSALPPRRRPLTAVYILPLFSLSLITPFLPFQEPALCIKSKDFMSARYHPEATGLSTVVSNDLVFNPSHGLIKMAKPSKRCKRPLSCNRSSRTAAQPLTTSMQAPSPKRPRFERSLAPSPSPPRPAFFPSPSPSSPPNPGQPPADPSSTPSPAKSIIITNSNPIQPPSPPPPPQLYNSTPLTTILNHPIYGPLPQTPVDPRELSRREVAFHTKYPGNRGYEIAEASLVVTGRERVVSVAVSPRSMSPEVVVGVGEGKGLREKEVWGEDVGDDGGKGRGGVGVGVVGGEGRQLEESRVTGEQILGVGVGHMDGTWDGRDGGLEMRF
jgi:hypothetical protein